MAFACCAPAQPASLLLRVKRVVALDPEVPAGADAVAFRAGKILAVGRYEVLRHRYGSPETRVLALPAGVAVPGLVDSHAHLLSLGLEGVDLRGALSLEEALERVRAAAARTPPGAWIRGRGWDQNDWPGGRFPTAEDLDRVAPEHPVALTRIDGHALWVNTEALRRAGITPETPDPPGGRILRDRKGRPTGILVDRATALVTRKLPPPSRADRRRALLAAQARCLAAGLVAVHDAGVDEETLALYRELHAAGQLKLRIYAMIGGEGPLLERYLKRGPEVDACDGHLTVRCVKLFADGALGSRGAALFAPYADDPGHRGLLLLSREKLVRLVSRCVAAGLQTAVHAIGDRANRTVLDVYAEILKRADQEDLRLRVEHCQVLHPGDVPRFARLGVVASVQPTHATSDGPWALARLGPERLRGAYLLKSLLATGAHVCGGSDFPVEEVSPLLGLYAAMTRRRVDRPEKGKVYGAEEAIAPEDALRLFTVEAAYAAFQEKKTGTLSPGKWGDVTVLSVDPLTAPPEALLRARVLATVVGGEVVYEAAAR